LEPGRSRQRLRRGGKRFSGFSAFRKTGELGTLPGGFSPVWRESGQGAGRLRFYAGDNWTKHRPPLAKRLPQMGKRLSNGRFAKGRIAAKFVDRWDPGKSSKTKGGHQDVTGPQGLQWGRVCLSTTSRFRGRTWAVFGGDVESGKLLTSVRFGRKLGGISLCAITEA